MIVKAEKNKLLTRRNVLRAALAAPAILALPRGLADAGCTYGYPGGVPAIASTNGLNTVAFFDDFNFSYSGSGTPPANATIDYLNTGASGFAERTPRGRRSTF
jgi:hypothetical protein